ncbi:Uracil-DNA glycosylase [Candida viswanathii]|uniref:Uracil-DNA glycosylase n=1 Tax=Candida viswanathii TaxID=5486 RepID=A0A367XWE9_9ASCO|nr:Uracil-DNA glycosylase [Candida viswanathii]
MSKRVLITDFFSKSTPKAKRVKVGKTKVMKPVDIKKDVTNGEATRVQEPVKEEKPQEEPVVESETKSDGNSENYDEFCKKYNFNKSKWVESLTPEQKDLLSLEIENIHITWLVFLHKELTKPYFLKLKKFLKSQLGKTIYPPAHQIYSWSHLTPLPDVKCLIIGQDPYHGANQAHGLAFSVLEPTRPPPSLVNIYKTIGTDYPDFKVPDSAKQQGGGNLTKWAKRGVLMLNAVLTVEAHKANSHANQGWEEFTENVIKHVIEFHKDDALVIMAWGSPAQRRVAKFKTVSNKDHFLVLRTVHPSPLSAYRGFFDLKVFLQCNDFLDKHQKDKIDWGLVEGNIVK